MSPFGPAGPAGPEGPSVPCKEYRCHGEFTSLDYSRYFKTKIFQTNNRWNAKIMLSIHICTIFPSGLTYNQHTELLLVHVHWPQRTFTALLTQLMYECVLMLS